jgi:hypothetical protein
LVHGVSPGAPFLEVGAVITYINNWQMTSQLEAPTKYGPVQNAWLTLTVTYGLTFADSHTRVQGVTVEDGGRLRGRDSDKKLFPIIDWDFESIMKFKRAFQRGEWIWNWQFLLITPRDYDELDYESMAGSGWLVRPNVLCVFRLIPAIGKPHLSINVVRLDPSIRSGAFRSNVGLYDYLDVWSPTLGHELGHALGQGHIKELLGDAECIADAKLNVYPDRCYGETPTERANIMGRESSFSLLNAKPWLDRINEHTFNRHKEPWTVTQMVGTPPRKIPLGVAEVASPKFF